MPRYIDADKLVNQMLSHYKALVDEYGERDAYASGYDDSIDTIQNFPTADVVEVVRCKDCRHRNTSKCKMWYHCVICGSYHHWERDEYYCSYGERKGGEDS